MEKSHGPSRLLIKQTISYITGCIPQCPLSMGMMSCLWQDFPPKEQWDHWTQFPKLSISIQVVRLQSHKGKGENGTRCLVSFVAVFKTLYASTPNSCLYLPSYYSINLYCSCIVQEVWTDSRRWIRKRGYLTSYDLTSVVTML